jgi:hypothetical protein
MPPTSRLQSSPDRAERRRSCPPGSRIRRPARAALSLAAGALSLALAIPAASASATSPPLSSAHGAASTPAAKATGSWYDPPSPLPGGPPGTIIRWRPWVFNLSPTGGVPAPAKVWQVMYLSTNTTGHRIAVTGTVLVPTSAWARTGPRPLVAYATGTQGWGDQCAPSREMKAGDYDEGFAVENLLEQGWAVAVTDYPGLGVPGDELYAVNSAEGYAVLDILRAAERLPGAKVAAGAPVAIEGYSQGGGAAAFAAQEQARYAPKLDLVGAALGGTPANLQAVAANINGSAFFAFLGGAAIGFNAAYPLVHLDSYLNAAGRKAFHELDGMCQEQALATFAGKSIEDYTKGGIDPLNLPKIERILDANDAGKTAPSSVPVLQYHGLADEVIPYAVEQTLHDEWCHLGAVSDLVSFPGEHVSTQVEAQVTVEQWLSNRFAGTTPPDNC